MVSALLDELPCLVDEADELMARLSCHMTLLKTRLKSTTPSSSTEASTTQNMVINSSKPDQKHSLSARNSPSSAQSIKNQSMTEIRQTMDDLDMDAIIKFFARQYLTMQSISFEKMHASLPAEALERSVLHTVASNIYQLMKRLHHWQQAAWESLTRFSADNSSNDSCLLTLESHPQLTRLVLATVARYIKVNLLWTSFNIIPGLLGLYTFLHHVQTIGGDTLTGAGTSHIVYSPLEHTDHRVREFVLHFGTAPLLAIQHDFQLQVTDKGASIAALALSCLEQYETCRDIAKLRHQGVFDLESLVSGAYASHPCLAALPTVSDVADWVICVVLSVPHQLQGDRTAPISARSIPSTPISPRSPTNSSSSLQLWDFMEIIARDRLVFTLHRNHVVNLHDLLYHQLTSSLSAAALTSGTTSSPSMPSFKSNHSSTSLKKTMIALSKFALRNCGVNHRQRREVALWLVHNCVQLMQHNPGIIAPSFPLLLAALAIARDEVEWAMSHRLGVANTEGDKAPLVPSHVKVKHLQRLQLSFCGVEKELADLLSRCHHLRKLLEQHSHLLTKYYQVFLVNKDAEGIAYTIQHLLATNDSTSELQTLLDGFLDIGRYRVNTSSSPRVTWVREWRQANAHLATRPQLPLLDVLRARMECAVRHTQYICISAQLIEHATIFSKCWWFRNVVFDQCFEQTLTTAPASALGLVELLSSLAAGSYIIDELVDTEEAAQQSERMLQRIDEMRTSIVNQVELGLEASVKRDVKLQQHDKSAVPQEELEPVENRSNRRLSSFPRVQSSQVQRPSNAELRLPSPTSSVLTRTNDTNSSTCIRVKSEQIGDEEGCLELVRALLDHIGQHYVDSTVKNAIVRRVQSTFVRFLRGFVSFSSSKATLKTIEGVTLRCSIGDACVQIRCFLRAAQRLFGCSKHASDNMNDVPLGQAVQAVLTKVLADECSASTSILPQDKKLLEWTMESPRVSEKELEDWSLVDRLSWLFVSFVTKRCHPSPSPSSTTAVSSPPILAAVRKRCFVLAPRVSGELDPRTYTNPEALQNLVVWIGSAGVESICSTMANLLVVQTLKLRSSIEAEHAVLAFMELATSGSLNAGILTTAQVRALDDIATQLVQIGTAVFLLQLVHDHSPRGISDAWEIRVAPRLLYELQQDPNRRATWTRLLPVACSAGFHSSVWKRTTFLSRVEATDTNAHMMGLAMARLLPSPHTSESVHRCAVVALKRASMWTGQPSMGRSKLQLDPLSSKSSTRSLLEALELLVTTAASTAGEAAGPHASALGELELSLERLLPHAMLVLHADA